MRAALLLAVLASVAFAAALLAPPVLATTGDPTKAGAYCPFPAKGEAQRCFDGVQQDYSDFFRAVEEGEVGEEHEEQLRQDLATGGERGYGAVSSLAYAYYRYAERAAASDTVDPAVVARLERWNRVLSSVYEDERTDPGLRGAVQAAAEDLHARAPAVGTQCAGGASGESCQTTGLLLQTLRRIDDPADERGVRGALSKLLGRMLGSDDGDELALPTSSQGPKNP